MTTDNREENAQRLIWDLQRAIYSFFSERIKATEAHEELLVTPEEMRLARALFDSGLDSGLITPDDGTRGDDIGPITMVGRLLVESS